MKIVVTLPSISVMSKNDLYVTVFSTPFEFEKLTALYIYSHETNWDAVFRS